MMNSIHINEASAWLDDVPFCLGDGKRERATYALSQAQLVIRHIPDPPEWLLDKMDKSMFLLSQGSLHRGMASH